MAPDPHTVGFVIGQLLGYLCCCGTPFLAVVIVLYLVLRKKPPASPGAVFVVPTPDATWATHRFPALGLQLSVPPGVKAQDVGGQVRIELPSGYDYQLARGDLAARLAERRAWLETTPYRTRKQVLLTAPDAFAYQAQEGDLPDLSFVAGKALGAATWLVETHGSRVEHGDLAAQAEANMTAEDRARMAQVQRQLQDAFARGERPDGPVVRQLMDEIGAITARSMPKQVSPSRVTTLTPLECAQGVAVVRSIRPA